MDFYDDVLRELLVAVGAALFVGNLLALLRRRAPAPFSDHDDSDDADGDGEVVPRAPLARTITYLVLGLVIALWGIASLAAGG